MGRKPIVGIFSVGLEEPYRWKDSVQNPEEIRLWAIDGIANGLRPWFTKFAGSVNDPRWLKPVEDLYEWCYRAEPYLRNERPLARVGLVTSQQSTWFVTEEHGARNAAEDAALGWYQALIEARIPSKMVHDRLLDAEHIAQFKTLILPNVTALSTAQCDQLRRFVARGGGIVATHETSLYDEEGGPRKDFGLADLFGVSFAGRAAGPMHNAYLRLEHNPARAHPLLRGLEDAPRIIHGAWRLEVTMKEKFPSPPLTFIPPYPTCRWRKSFRAFRGPTSRRFSCARRARAAWSISRGTSTAPSGRSSMPTTRSSSAMPSSGPPMKNRPSSSADMACWMSPCGGRKTRSPSTSSTSRTR